MESAANIIALILLIVAGYLLTVRTWHQWFVEQEGQLKKRLAQLPRFFSLSYEHQLQAKVRILDYT
jgi:hypothetical protein